jgi:hypothetical protein
VLIKLGFKPLIANNCIYRHPKSGLIVTTYVDDFLLVGLKGKELTKLKSALQNAFEIKDLGPCYYFIGVRIVRNRENRTISLVQDAYVNKVLKRFKISDCKVSKTLLDPAYIKLMVSNLERAIADQIKLYQQIVSSLMYLST